MKAIILAGGKGTRLRPLSLNKPKPMLPLFSRPLLLHLLTLLKSSGVTEVLMTLQYLPGVIRDYFGDGSEWGMRIRYRTETEPRGTAGSVRDCLDFIGGEDFFVLSGDAALAADLPGMGEKHRLSGAEATLMVKRCLSPLEYGLVLADEDGFIRAFAEKPEREGVCSEQVNTGVYVLSPAILEEIPPDRPCDFGGELFPRLLRENRRLRVWEEKGYWNDVGSPEAYLRSCRDVLDGVFPLPVPRGRDFGEKVWVSPEAEVDPTSFLGPYTVVGAGTKIGPGCRVSGSVLEGAVLTGDNTVEGSILEKGAMLGKGAALRDRCVLAEGACVGAGSLLREGVRLWPGVSVPPEAVVTRSITAPGSEKLSFGPAATLRGEAGSAITPEVLMCMGRGAGPGPVGAAAAGGCYASLLAEAFLLGAAGAGAEAFRADASRSAVLTAAGEAWGLGMTLFVSQEGSRVCLRFFDGLGLPLPRKEQRSLESARDAAPERFSPEKSGTVRTLTGAEELFLAACPGDLTGRKLSTLSPLLARALKRAGAEVLPPAEGLIQLRLSEDGFNLTALDERGREQGWDRLLCAWAMLEYEAGENALAFPYDAPALIERIAEAQGATVYRLERDGAEARRLYREKGHCRNGVRLCLRLLTLLGARGEGATLAALMDALPERHTRERVLRVSIAEAEILRRLASERSAETVRGVRLRTGDAVATLRSPGPGELRILTESGRMEAAEEFSLDLIKRIRAIEETQKNRGTV